MRDGQAVLNAQSFSCLLDAKLTAFGDGQAELVVPLSERVRQQNGFAHGGLVAYAADNAIAFAAGTTVGPAVLTSEFKVNYVSAAQGEEIVARATVVHAGSKLVVVRCDVYDRGENGERLCAVAQGTVVRVA